MIRIFGRIFGYMCSMSDRVVSRLQKTWLLRDPTEDLLDQFLKIDSDAMINLLPSDKISALKSRLLDISKIEQEVETLKRDKQLCE